MCEASQKFEWALKNGDLEQVKSLAGKSKELVNKQLSTGRLPLCVAADYGQLNILKFLVLQGAQVDVLDKHGISPLLAAIYEDHVECVKFLLEKGAKRTGSSPDGKGYKDCTENELIKKLLV